MSVKPILFNTEMVRAIQEGRKVQTRRIVKGAGRWMDFIEISDQMAITAVDRAGNEYPKDVPGTYATFESEYEPHYPVFKSAYEVGDLLYVRETWNYGTVDSDCKEYSVPECWFEEEDWRNDGKYKYIICRFWYKADPEDEEDMVKLGGRWRPSIHMPKEAARIWLRVTGIECQRIQNITVDDARAEGIVVDEYSNEAGETFHTDNDGNTWEAEMSEEADTLLAFQTLWDSTVQKTELKQYGWNANPWVWVYHFERCEKP